MALKLACDGCACDVSPDTKPVGRLEPAFYCPECREAYDTHIMLENQRREELVEAFLAWRREARATLRTKLTRLPDE